MTPNAHGPDVSHYQHLTGAPVPTWSVFSCKLSEGRGGVDKTAANWLVVMARIGVRYRGFYHWLRSDSPMSVQADVVRTRLRLLGLVDVNGALKVGHFIQTDWETTENVPNLTPAQVAEFNDRLRQMFGDRVITYSSDWVPGFASWRRANPADALWYANYNLTAKPTGGYAECIAWGADVWQWTSTFKGGGIASGTPGKPATDTGYDMNHVFNWATLDRLCALNTAPPPVPTPSPIQFVTPLQAAATGEDNVMLEFVADATNPTSPVRWLSNNMVRTTPTYEHAIRLVAEGKVSNTLNAPRWLSPQELAGLPLVAG